MPIVHIFSSSNRFTSYEALQAFVLPTYSEEGERIDSLFMREVGFTEYEPMSIESVHSERAQPLADLLASASYSEQWFSRLVGSSEANSAVCVFSPNKIIHPERSSMNYFGAICYSPSHR
jgi:hypothetical protein